VKKIKASVLEMDKSKT